MAMDAKLEQALTRYKLARDSALHADEDSFQHHLHEFVRELRRNTLTKPTIDGLPSFDVNGWLEPAIERWKRTRDPIRFSFPENEDERLAIYWDLLESMTAEPEEEKFSYPLHRPV